MKPSEKDLARARLEISLEGLVTTASTLLKYVGRDDPLDTDWAIHLYHLIPEIQDDLMAYGLTHRDSKS